MSDWLHNLPVIWMALIVFGFTYLIATLILFVVSVLAVGKRARSFKAVSPGILPPLGILFGLFVAFTASQVWSDSQAANEAVDREASALRTVVILASMFPGDAETHLRTLIHDHIEDVANHEWPTMAHRTANLRTIPHFLAEALEFTLGLAPNNAGQRIAQRDITTALGTALEARRQRILISRSEVNWVKWSTLFLQAVCALIAIAMVHSDDRLASGIVLAVFATGIAISVLLILAHDRPFIGAISISPDPILQVMPQAGSAQPGAN
jgi:hypothetical protein